MFKITRTLSGVVIKPTDNSHQFPLHLELVQTRSGRNQRRENKAFVEKMLCSMQHPRRVPQIGVRSQRHRISFLIFLPEIQRLHLVDKVEVRKMPRTKASKALDILFLVKTLVIERNLAFGFSLKILNRLID